ncbi:AN1-type zinc finger protein 2B [Elysia marginata]|uniref:AN1-type zinc finger protein 2B n=1 Tax=Elysia marginata TaxID=1093978 RepID=A0AAV4GR86_9GAST|nr:AN1-type zinc finger protein 2B [Elysia marginata]
MELPHIGQHCNEPSCKQLDFLPMKCDACDKIFCRDHIHYPTHRCPESYKKDKQIPVCPLCNRPCPLLKGELPDVVVGRHIESDCQSDPAKERRKVYTNKCSQKGCKKKELIPVKCETCHQNFCLRHRHERDHECKGFQGTGRGMSNAGAAALFRAQQSGPSTAKKPSGSTTGAPNRGYSSNNNHLNNSRPPVSQQRANVSSLQGTMGEDEALARALQLSMASDTTSAESQTQGMTEQEREDFLLAQALSASEQESSRTPQSVRA